MKWTHICSCSPMSFVKWKKGIIESLFPSFLRSHQTLRTSLSLAIPYLMKVVVSPVAILNVFCLSVSVCLVDTCLGYTSCTVTDLSPPTPPSLSPLCTHPSLTTSPLGFVILPRCPRFPIIFTPPLFPPHCFLLLPSFPTCPFPPFSSSPLSPFSYPLFPLFLIFLLSLFISTSWSLHLFKPSPTPPFFPDENTALVHGRQDGTDRSCTSARWAGTCGFNDQAPEATSALMLPPQSFISTTFPHYHVLF